MEKSKTLLTLDEAARYLAVSKTTLRRWTNEGTLACHRVGLSGQRRFEQKVLDAHLKRNPEMPSSGPAPSTARADDPDSADQSRHICLYVPNPEARWEAFRSFFLHHYHARHPTIYLHSASTREELLENVCSEGLDPEAVLGEGLLQLIHARDSYLRKGFFSEDAQLRFIRMQILRQRAEDHPVHLISGEMDWFFTQCDGTERIHEYENRLNDLLAEFPGVTIVCQYDLSRFSGLDAIQACCSHPEVIFQRNRYRGFFAPNHGAQAFSNEQLKESLPSMPPTG